MTYACRLLWILIATAATLLAATGTALAQHEKEIVLWPDGLPAGSVVIDPQRAEQLKAQSTLERIRYVDQPTLTLFPPPAGSGNGCAVIVCPGGGYNLLAWDHEGIEIARWLNTLGVHAAVLKYRVPRRNPDLPHKEPLQDAQRAVRTVRFHSKAWGVDPKRLGILGFSAGGNLSVMAGTHFHETTYPPRDPIDQQSCRPDFLIPIYPAYLGNERKAELKLNPLVRVTGQTPPTFVAVTSDDKMRGLHAALLFAHLKRVGVPAELHIFVRGGHGYGMRPSAGPVSQWPHLCADWMRASGFLPAKQP